MGTAAGVGDRSLAQQLARAERTKKLKAVLLTAPLFVFLVISFLGPIGALLTKSFVDTELAAALPNVSREIKRWDGRGLPDEATFAALIADVRAARAAGTLAPAATRLNYDISGFRTLLFSTARALPDTLEASAREALLAIDPKWGETETWGAIARAAGPTT
jgi:putative spermidine/putrescine transport system permease protein